MAKVTWAEYKKIIAELDTRLVKEMSTKKFRQWLDEQQNFWAYSHWNNAILHFCGATLVKGYKGWESLGRHVKRGQEGIRIYAPIMEIRESGKGLKEENVVGFRSVSVFDISQTDGKPLVDAPLVKFEVGGELPADYKAKMKALCKANKLKLTYQKLDGLYGRTDGIEIQLAKGLTAANELSAFFHEVAHTQLHYTLEELSYPSLKGLKEAEAEATSYIMLRLLNVKKKEIAGSINYIIHHLNRKQFRDYSIVHSMQRIKKAVDCIAKHFIKIDEEVEY